jgi:hypothetical protein
MSDGVVLALAQIALGLVVMVAACLMVRRLLIARRGGIVECCLRSRATGRWQHGLAEYRREQLYWHRSLSLRLRPRAALYRRDLIVTGSRPAGADEADWLGPGTVIVTCQARPLPARRSGSLPGDDHLLEMAMSRGALTGYLAWLEGAPAGYLSGAS